METLQAIRKRRSIRQYQPRLVEEDKLMAVLDAARWAPSAVNGQPWDFVVVRGAELRQRLVQFILGAHRTVFSQASLQSVSGAQLDQRMESVYSTLPQAPVYVVVCLHRKRAYVKQEYDQGAFLFDVESVAAAMENLLLAACFSSARQPATTPTCRGSLASLTASLVSSYPARRLYTDCPDVSGHQFVLPIPPTPGLPKIEQSASVKTSAPSSSRQASSPASEVVLAPWNSSLSRLSK